MNLRTSLLPSLPGLTAPLASPLCGTLLSLVGLAVAAVPSTLAAQQSPAASQQASKPRAGKTRPVNHDDYDTFPSLRGTSFSRDGLWMSYTIGSNTTDNVLHIREIDGDKTYEYPNGERVRFSEDGTLAIFKIGKSKEEERRKKIEKLHEKKEEKKKASNEEEESTPPDIMKALEERGMTEAMAMRMKEQRGASWAEVREFLSLPTPEKKEPGKEAPEKGSKKKEPDPKKAKEDAEKKEAKALSRRLHVLNLATGELTKLEDIKGFSHPEESQTLILHFHEPEKEKDKKKDDSEKQSAKEEGAKAKGTEEKPAEGAAKPARTKGKAEQLAEEVKTQVERSKRAIASEAGAGSSGTEKAPAEKAKATKKEDKDPLEKRRSDGTKLVIRDLASGSDTTLEHVVSYGLIKDDTWMWYFVGTKKVTEGVDHGLYARELASGKTIKLMDGYASYGGITLNRDETKLLFTSNVRTFAEEESEDRKTDFYLWDLSGAAAKRILTSDAEGIPEGYTISGRGSFTDDGSMVTFSIKPPKRDDLPKILSEDEVKLDVWHFQDGLLQTMQARRGDPRDATLSAMYDLGEDRVTVLGTPDSPRVSLITPDGSRALVSDSKPYEQQVTWDGRYSDYYIVNTLDGSRTKIIEALRGSASASPTGRYVTWFDHRDYHWHSIDVSTMERRNLTEGMPVAFDRAQDDRPEPHRAHGTAGWTEDEKELLLYDEFDIWAVSPATGDFRCVTDGLGRRENLSLRMARMDLRPDAEREDEEDNPNNWVKGDITLRATDLDTYASGYYSDHISKAQKPKRIVMGDYSLGRATRPENADRMFFTISRFDQFPDMWTADLDFGNMRRLTNACSKLNELSWGSAELVNWTSADGVDLKGYLIKPDGFDASKKYPMMVYFYERSSQGIHRFVTPSPGTSPNAAYYVSNGYLWFVPDIVYTEGYPGESCEKCVIPGVQHLLAKGFVDEDAIGIAGHSWGGYQTAHLVTRTNLFAAAESGAPVVNMFSAYGGIRWASGMSRQFQYEQTQSRIGGTIWETPMRYWQNSPLFYLDRVQTPVLILHNDEDGAVPWYQGIEFFVGLRRLQKEAYLLNYNDEAHGLRRRQNQRDWTRRMQEFFDHHLKGAPMPEWMERGVPFHERMEEKIPNAPSYREAMEAGLLETTAAPEPEPAITTAPATEPAGNR